MRDQEVIRKSKSSRTSSGDTPIKVAASALIQEMNGSVAEPWPWHESRSPVFQHTLSGLSVSRAETVSPGSSTSRPVSLRPSFAKLKESVQLLTGSAQK